MLGFGIVHTYAFVYASALPLTSAPSATVSAACVDSLTSWLASIAPMPLRVTGSHVAEFALGRRYGVEPPACARYP